MSYPVFMVPAGDVIPIFFDSFDGGTGASITLTGLAVTDIEIYKDGSATQRSSDAGYTLLDTDGIDFDGITGIHGFSIDTGDNTDSGFYTVGAWFTVVVSAVTIDAQTVSFIAAQFRIMKAESVAGVPKADVDAWLGTAAATPTTAGVPEVDVTHWLGTAAATPSVAGVPEVDLTHVAGSTTNVAALATNVDAILTDTGTTLDNLVDDLESRLGTPSDLGSGATIAANLSDLKTETAAILVDTGTTLDDLVDGIESELAKVPKSDSTVTWNATALASIQSEANDALVAYDPPTRAELTTDVNSIIAYLDGLVIAKGTIGSTGNSTTALHLTGLTYGDDEINNYLIAIHDVSAGEWHARYIEDWADTGDLATVATLPFTPENAVDTYAILAFRQDVTGGAGLDAAGVRAAIGLASANLDTQLDALPTAAEVWAAGTRTLTAIDEDSTTLDLDATIRGAVGLAAADLDTQLGALPTAAENADAVWDEAATGHTDAGKAGEQLWTDLDAVLADTNELQTDDYPTSIADIEGKVDDLEGRLTATRAGYLDNLSAGAVALEATAQSILTDTGTTLDNLVDDLESRLGTPSDLGSGATVAANLADIKGETAAILDDTDDIGVAGAGLTEAGGTGDHLTALATAAQATAIETDTQDIQGRIPTALVGGRIDATVDATGMETGAIDAILTRAMTESYSTDGSTMTVAQALYLITQRLTEFAISGTTVTVKRLDGSTTALTLTLDDADAPTSSTRAS